MDKNYSGGWLQMERLSKTVSRKEITEMVSFDKVEEGLVEAFDQGLKGSSDTRNAIVSPNARVVESLDIVHTCAMCKNFFTVNRSYGKHDCYAHYGYRDFTNPGNPKWSCCGNLLSSLGCMECDHLSEESNKSYSTPCPTMEISLGAAFYGASLPASKSFFFKRYLTDRKLKRMIRKDPNYLRVRMRYLEENTYRSLISSSALAQTRAKYLPYIIKTRNKDGTIKKRERIYINVNATKLIVPLYRRD